MDRGRVGEDRGSKETDGCPLTLPGDKIALDRCVPTRWNSDLTCLDAHLYFRSPVEQLTGAAVNKLQAYRLSEEQ
jgi:hypothetical protein